MAEAAPEFPARALPLVTTVDNVRFQVGEEALSVLQRVPGNLSIVAVAGPYRSGKSFLLNRLVQHPRGFGVGGTVEACTRGIWIWGQPLLRTLPSGEKAYVIVMDTEGLSCSAVSQEYDARVFSLAVLLASTLVFNSMGTIDEGAIDQLGLIVHLAQRIQVHSNTEAAGAPAANGAAATVLRNYFPSFVWVLRDFSLVLRTAEGSELTPNTYMERELAQRGTAGERQRVRELIKSHFERRDCVPMSRPFSTAAELARADEQEEEAMRAPFRRQLGVLRSLLFDAPQLKTLNGRVLNGRMLAQLVRSYVHAINDNGVPSIGNAWNDVAQQECKLAADRAMERYTESMAATKAALPVDADELLRAHTAAVEEALRQLHTQVARAWGAAADAATRDLQERFAKRLPDLVTTNTALSKEFCQKLLQRLMDAHQLDAGDASAVAAGAAEEVAVEVARAEMAGDAASGSGAAIGAATATTAAAAAGAAEAVVAAAATDSAGATHPAEMPGAGATAAAEDGAGPASAALQAARKALKHMLQDYNKEAVKRERGHKQKLQTELTKVNTKLKSTTEAASQSATRAAQAVQLAAEREARAEAATNRVTELEKEVAQRGSRMTELEGQVADLGRRLAEASAPAPAQPQRCCSIQ